MEVQKRDIDLIEWAVDICDTNIGAGDENPESEKILSDLKNLLSRMKKDKPTA